VLEAMARIALSAGRHAAERFKDHIRAESLRLNYSANRNLETWLGVGELGVGVLGFRGLGIGGMGVGGLGIGVE
jgi:hypothetical protein